jgi:hypothetical protein
MHTTQSLYIGLKVEKHTQYELPTRIHQKPFQWLGVDFYASMEIKPEGISKGVPGGRPGGGEGGCLFLTAKLFFETTRKEAAGRGDNGGEAT